MRGWTPRVSQRVGCASVRVMAPTRYVRGKTDSTLSREMVNERQRRVTRACRTVSSPPAVSIFSATPVINGCDVAVASTGRTRPVRFTSTPPGASPLRQPTGSPSTRVDRTIWSSLLSTLCGSSAVLGARREQSTPSGEVRQEGRHPAVTVGRWWWVCPPHHRGTCCRTCANQVWLWAGWTPPTPGTTVRQRSAPGAWMDGLV
jgi:hypothetical protein